jgi:hypothetical protein
MSADSLSDLVAIRSTLRDGLYRPKNQWFVLDIGKRFATYISNDGSPLEISYVIGLYTSEYFVSIGSATGENFLYAEFQIDQGPIWEVTHCFSGCDQRIPRTEHLFDNLRNGTRLRYGGEVGQPPSPDYRDVPLIGIGPVIDQL